MASRIGELRMEPRPPAPAVMRRGGAGLSGGAWPDRNDGRGLLCEGRGLAAALTAAPPGGRQDGGGAVKMAAPRGPRRHGLRCATRRDTTRHLPPPSARRRPPAGPAAPPRPPPALPPAERRTQTAPLVSAGGSRRGPAAGVPCPLGGGRVYSAFILQLALGVSFKK